MSDAYRLSLPRFTDRLSIRGVPVPVSPFLLAGVQASDVVEEAYERGINFFLLGADLHWPRYERTRTGLASLIRKGRRDEIAVAVVSYSPWPHTAAAAIRECIASVEGLERIDLPILGGVDAPSFVPRLLDFQQGQLKGEVCASSMGMGIDDPAVMCWARQRGLIDCALMPCQPAVPLRLPSADAESDELPPVYSFGNAWTTREQLASVGLTSNDWHPTSEDYYRFPMTYRCVAGTVLSASSKSLSAVARAFEAGPLREDELQYMLDVAELVAGRARLDNAPV